MAIDKAKLEDARDAAAQRGRWRTLVSGEAADLVSALLAEREEREAEIERAIKGLPDVMTIREIAIQRVEVLSVLREVEWVKHWNGDRYDERCPACGSSRLAFVPDEALPLQHRGRDRSPHAPDCCLAKILGGGP